MKTLLRTLLYLALIVWLGAEIFFPVVAAITFMLLRILHGMGFVSGMIALALLALAPAWGIYKPRAVLPPMGLVVLMIVLTAFSQFVIIPTMERDRIAAGGAIDTTDAANPNTIDFNKLHNRSETVEEAILLFGLVTVILVAKAETSRV